MKFSQKIINLTIISSVVITIFIWISQIYLNNGWYPVDYFTKNIIGFKYAGKASALSATILICWSFMLNTRFGWTKYFFEDNQSIIETNKNVTNWAFVLMFIDPIFLAINRLPNISLFLSFFGFRLTSGSYSIGHNLGLVSLLLIVFLTFIIRQKWLSKVSLAMFRSLFGLIPFLLICHIFFVRSDISKYLPLTLWVYGFLVVAMLSYIYTVYLDLKNS